MLVFIYPDWYKPPPAIEAMWVLIFSQAPQKLPISRSTYHGQKKGSELVDLTVQHLNMLIRFLLLENLPTHVVDLEDIL
jgi:hypothetical protein